MQQITDRIEDSSVISLVTEGIRNQKYDQIVLDLVSGEVTCTKGQQAESFRSTPAMLTAVVNKFGVTLKPTTDSFNLGQHAPDQKALIAYFHFCQQGANKQQFVINRLPVMSLRNLRFAASKV